jgi:hypothetical protein
MKEIAMVTNFLTLRLKQKYLGIRNINAFKAYRDTLVPSFRPSITPHVRFQVCLVTCWLTHAECFHKTLKFLVKLSTQESSLPFKRIFQRHRLLSISVEIEATVFIQPYFKVCQNQNNPTMKSNFEMIRLRR